MRKTILSLLFLFTFYASYAQDIITKRNGEEIEAKVAEITINVIKYKRFDNLDGPLIHIAKSDVFMILYENGTKETFTDSAPAPAASPVVSGPAYPTHLHSQQVLKLSGPRVGFTILSQRYVDYANDQEVFDVALKPFITQFGWQFETRFFTLDNGGMGLFELVPLIGGVEQGKILPSLSALIGFRGPKGAEIGVGPNISLSGAGIVIAAGTNFQSQGINFPVNVAIAPSRHGIRASLLIGFNSRQF